MGSFFNIFTRLDIILVVLSIFVIGVTFFVYKTKNKVEGFYPVNDQRINAQDISTRRYNEFADIQDRTKEGVIPSGPSGDPVLAKLLGSPTYEGDSSKKNLAGPAFTNPLPYRTPPEQTELLERIKMCESLKTWDCKKINDPEFERFCGICTENGQDHLGKPHIGGLYIDILRRQMETENAKANNRKPDYVPTTGVCKGKFLLSRPLCDIEKDRDDCSKYMNFDNKGAKDKCGQCVYNDKMLYIGNRGQKNSNYALIKKPVTFTSNLKFVISHPKEAIVLGVFNAATGKRVPGNFIPNTSIYMVSIQGQENQEFKIRISYPEYKPYVWSKEDNENITKLMAPKRLQLVQAKYGPWLNDYKHDDPRAADVTEYVKKKFNMIDCSKMDISVSNDGLGIDPTPGIHKQLRLVYGENGIDFVYAFGGEGTISKPILTDNFESLCPTDIPPTAAEKKVCETDAEGNPIEGRVYTQGRNSGYSGAGSAWCVEKIKNTNRGIVGLWESKGRVSRIVPLDISVTQINGFNTSSAGPEKLGTLKGSKYFKSIMPASAAPGMPGYLFWFWAKDKTLPSVEYTVVVPATLRDPTVDDDITLCPMGPIVSTQEAATRLKSGACEQPVNGLPQGPGSFSEKCIQSLFIASGCTIEGKAYPSNSAKLDNLTRDKNTGDNMEIDTITSAMDDMYLIATTGTNFNKDSFEEKTIEKYSIDCLGITKRDPCDTPFRNTGPHTPQCLDYLFKNAGASNSAVGQTYPGMYNRSSGTKQNEKSPVMYCQRAGSMSPIGSNGKINYDAVTKANSKGGIPAVKEFYREIHYNANFNKDIEPQKKALSQCYGIGVKPQPVVCAKKEAKFVYKGCWGDSGDRAISNYSGQVTSADQCYTIAKQNNASVFGLQFGGQCFTGTNKDWNRFGKRDDASCGPLGSAWTNQVYTIGSSSASSQCSNTLLPGNVSIQKGNKIGNLNHNGDYDLSFKINVNGVVGNWGSILHFTKSGKDCCNLGDRGPGIWFFPGTTKLYIILGDSTQGGDWGLRQFDIVLPMGKESTFKLTCKGKSITLVVNSQEYRTTQPGQRPTGVFDVYSADPWYDAANANLKDLCFSTI